MTVIEWDNLTKERQTILSYIAYMETNNLEWRSPHIYKLWKESGFAGDWRGFTRELLKKR